jgi:phosphate transport system protein
MTDHTYRQFDTDIDAMRSAVSIMGGLVERQFVRAVDAVQHADLRLVTQVLEDERIVNQLHVESDLRCNQMIARRQPIAVDLREIIAVIHSINDLERIGDEAKKIALIAREVRLNERITPGFPEIRVVAALVIDMLRRALDALARLEAEDAPEIARLDREVDAHFQSIVRQLLTYMIEDPRTISPALDLVFVAKSLERIGDHAKNISECVVYMIKGRDVRHLPIEEMEQVARA